MESLMDALFGNDNQKIAALKRIEVLEKENERLKRENDRYAKSLPAWVQRCADLSRRMGKIKIQLIDLQFKSR